MEHKRRLFPPDSPVAGSMIFLLSTRRLVRGRCFGLMYTAHDRVVFYRPFVLGSGFLGGLLALRRGRHRGRLLDWEMVRCWADSGLSMQVGLLVALGAAFRRLCLVILG